MAKKGEKKDLYQNSLSWNEVSPKHEQLNPAYLITGLQLSMGAILQ